MTNVESFEQCLRENKIYFERKETDEGCSLFHIRQSMKNGGTVLLVVCFTKDQRIVDLAVLDVASVTDPLKKEPLQKLLNELNLEYRYTKFLEEEGEIQARYSYRLPTDEGGGDDVLDMLISVYKSTSENFPKFMKLQWN